MIPSAKSTTQSLLSKISPDLLDIVQVERELCKRHLRDFIQCAWHVLEPGTVYSDNWHIGAICEHLEAVTAGEIRKLIINIPPRTMKSLSVSVCWQPWVWITEPHTRWLMASYAQFLSTRDTVKARRVIQSSWYQERWGDVYQLAGDVNQKTNFENDNRGWRLATSPDSIGTGEGGHYQVLDDLHNVRQAESDTIREGTITWLDETMVTRYVDIKVGKRVLVMQRVHGRDAAGHLLAEGGYVHLCLPMRFEPSRLVPYKADDSPNKDYTPPTPLGFVDPRTEDGELLWKDHLPEEAVAEIEKPLGPYGTAGQLQQRPTPRGGGMFKRENYQIIDDIPEGLVLRYVRSWDYAATDPDKQISLTDPDWTAGVLLGATSDVDPDLYVLNVIRFRLEPGERDEQIAAIANMDGTQVVIWIEQEPGASGKSQIVQARVLLSGYAVNPPRIDPMPAAPGQKSRGATKEPGVPTGNKVTRAEALATYVYRRKVYLLRGEWNAEYIDEHAAFPLGNHDDQVDASSQGFMRIMEKPPSIAELMQSSGYYGR